MLRKILPVITSFKIFLRVLGSNTISGVATIVARSTYNSFGVFRYINNLLGGWGHELLLFLRFIFNVQLMYAIVAYICIVGYSIQCILNARETSLLKQIDLASR